MSHDITGMPWVDDPSKKFSKKSNINMLRSFGRLVVIDNINCRFIGFIDGARSEPRSDGSV